MAAFILPVYIVLLLVGGLMGYLKAGSKVSLVTSAAFALALIIAGYAGVPYAPQFILGLLIVLAVVFAARLIKTRKFMPAGLMVLLTLAALAGYWTNLPAAPGR
jgi:uncharacterized membrane protein (UPF0136 family)